MAAVKSSAAAEREAAVAEGQAAKVAAAEAAAAAKAAAAREPAVAEAEALAAEPAARPERPDGKVVAKRPVRPLTKYWKDRAAGEGKERYAQQNDCQPADIKWTSWQCLVPADCSLEDALSPSYLRAKVNVLKPGAEVTFRRADNAWWVHTIVNRVDPVAKIVSVTVLHGPVDLTGRPVGGLDWSKVRLEEREDASTGSMRTIIFYGVTRLGAFPSRPAADQWIAEQKRAEGLEA
jgi:hypothetical protein